VRYGNHGKTNMRPTVAFITPDRGQLDEYTCSAPVTFLRFALGGSQENGRRR
jgi:hypothetical protein